VEERPLLPPKFLEWLIWLSDYYMYPIGKVIDSCFPSLPKKGRKKDFSNLIPQLDSVDQPLELTNEQSTAFKTIKASKGFSSHLLFGVTGSGKTEVYLQSLKDIVEQDQQALILVPEISLTPQLIHRFECRFPGKVATIHSALTPREKTNQWYQCAEGSKNILIGARSALFCPMPNLQIIVIDEEHETSYKQDDHLRYHARDAAIMLAKKLNIPIVLGSATPSLETWQNALSGKYQLHELKNRVANRKMPSTYVVDLRTHKDQNQLENKSSETPFWMSDLLKEKISATLEKNQQVALFLNRRGLAQTVFCESCGYHNTCPNCEISLTLHNSNHLVCHYCDYDIVYKEKCPECHEPSLIPLGMGTEKIEEDIKKIFPQAKIARADRDEIQSRDELVELIRSVESKETDILIGTQMIAKGLDFPHLTLVGLVLADISFNIPDFRSTERSFQLLTQVSGRSGRHLDDDASVVIQTYNPDHPSILYAKNVDYRGFAEEELKLREELLYPPYGRLISLKITSIDKQKASKCASILNSRCEVLQNKSSYKNIQVLGPAESPIFRLRNKYRYHMLLKGPRTAPLKAFVSQLLADKKWIPAGTKVQIDVDPINML
ncbi:MAG: primosomal protein N', partial [Bdellovibrionales bacterium]|nr:primosomal protein N' [Bdellovibrionales bacterium]